MARIPLHPLQGRGWEKSGLRNLAVFRKSPIHENGSAENSRVTGNTNALKDKPINIVSMGKGKGRQFRLVFLFITRELPPDRCAAISHRRGESDCGVVRA